MTITQHLVTPANIQSELSRIWDSLESANKVRANLFNLIFYTPLNSRTDYVRQVAQKVIEKFPSRVIFVVADKTPSQDYLKTQVAVVSPNKSENTIACDYIEINFAGAQQQRVPFVILPHILPDLPVYLIWADDPTLKDPLLAQLEKLSDRLIVDSETTNDLQLFAKTCLDVKKQSQFDLGDLNWARMESWRDLLSLAFCSEDKVAELNHITSLQLTYNAIESSFFCHTKIQALYLQAWLATRLNWQLTGVRKAQENLLLHYRKTQGEVNVVLSPARHSHFNPGMVISIDLTTEQDVHFSLCRNLEFTHQINMITSTPEKCEMPTQFIFPKAESGQSLVKEISHKGTSSHYLKVLNLIASMEPKDLC